ncbi:MAG: pilus assembly protein PilM, partial [Bacteroides sp.]|nr:pilus assembly protein PilM [Bacteroides sp.]
IADDDIDFLLRKGNDFYLSDFIVVNTSAVYFAINGDEKLYSDVRGMYADSVDACVSYVLAERRFVNMFDGVADKLGFKDVRYIASNWAECVALLDNEQRENTYVLIDVGYLSSSVSIAKGEGVLDMKSFSLGGAHISADICEALDVPFEYAEEAKSLVDINLNYSDGKWLVHRDEQEIMACEVVPIVKGRLDVFASVISSIIDGFAENTSSYLPIYLTGEGIASMRGARKYLSEKIGKNIELVTPKLPGFVKAEDSSKTALLLMADTLYKEGIGGMIKSIFNGGKK